MIEVAGDAMANWPIQYLQENVHYDISGSCNLNIIHGNSGKGMAPEILIVKYKNLRTTARDIHDKFYHTNSQLSNARDVNKCFDSIRHYISFNRNVHRVSFFVICHAMFFSI